MAACVIVWYIARSKTLHAIGGNLIKPGAIDMVRIMCGTDALSNGTVRRSIAYISGNDMEQLFLL